MNTIEDTIEDTIDKAIAAPPSSLLPWCGPLVKHTKNPILAANPSQSWEAGSVYNASTVVWNDAVWMVYRAEDVLPADIREDNLYTSRLGLARSVDGLHFERVREDPILDTEGPWAEYKTRGVEDPRVTRMDDGRFLMTYTAFSGRSLADFDGTVKLFLAESDDLHSWHEHGPIFSFWAKSGGILSERVAGRYWMYYGEGDIWLASSLDGITWEPQPAPALVRFPGTAENGIEVGAPPFLTSDGIVLIYNRISGGELMHYEPGVAVFDRDDPARLLWRSPDPLLRGEIPEEFNIRLIQNMGKDIYTLFAMGTARMNGQFFLYYGRADESVCAATASLTQG